IPTPRRFGLTLPGPTEALPTASHPGAVGLPGGATPVARAAATAMEGRPDPVEAALDDRPCHRSHDLAPCSAATEPAGPAQDPDSRSAHRRSDTPARAPRSPRSGSPGSGPGTSPHHTHPTWGRT